MLIMENEFIYNFESLLFDKSFRRWIFLKGTEEENVFWDSWKSKNNQNKELCNEAKAILFAINLSGKYLSDDEIDFEVKKVLNKKEINKESAVQTFINNFQCSTSPSFNKSTKKKIFQPILDFSDMKHVFVSNHQLSIALVVRLHSKS